MSNGTAAAFLRFERALPRLGVSDVSLAPGATQASIDAFEAATGLELPEEVRELFRGHDGQTSARVGLAAGFHFVSLHEAQKLMHDWAATRAQLGESIKDLDRACSSQPREAIQRKYSLPGWMPLLRDNEGNAIGVDLQPASEGRFGQVINFGRDEDEKFVLFPSATELMEWLATQLEADQVVLDPHDQVVCHAKGRLLAAILADGASSH